MSKSIKTVVAISLVAFVAACGGSSSKPQETVYVEQPVVAEPVSQKY